MSGGWPEEIWSGHLSFLTDDHNTPVIEPTLPELAKVDRDLYTVLCDVNKVPLRNLVPREVRVMGGVKWTRCRYSYQYLVCIFIKSLTGDVESNFEVLTNTSDNWLEGTLHLPIDSIIESVEENSGLISDEDILVSE